MVLIFKDFKLYSNMQNNGNKEAKMQFVLRNQLDAKRERGSEREGVSINRQVLLKHVLYKLVIPSKVYKDLSVLTDQNQSEARIIAKILAEAVSHILSQ